MRPALMTAFLLLTACQAQENPAEPPASANVEIDAAPSTPPSAPEDANAATPAAAAASNAAATSGAPGAAGALATGSAGACLMQGSEKLDPKPLHALGTEPFWGARIVGRCVNYSHPEDEAGTRIWARYTKQADGGTWSGALGGRPFELRTRAKPGCSDGMSDKSYPIAVELTVNGEKRKGCAEPV